MLYILSPYQVTVHTWLRCKSHTQKYFPMVQEFKVTETCSYAMRYSLKTSVFEHIQMVLVTY